MSTTTTKIKDLLNSLVNPKTSSKEEYINSLVSLLRRDFDPDEQNKILQDSITKIIELRKQDMLALEKEYISLKQKNIELTNMLVTN